MKKLTISDKLWIVFVAIAGWVLVGLIENSFGLGFIAFCSVCSWGILVKLTE